MQGTEIKRDEETRQVAYKLWQEEGCPDAEKSPSLLREAN